MRLRWTELFTVFPAQADSLNWNYAYDLLNDEEEPEVAGTAMLYALAGFLLISTFPLIFMMVPSFYEELVACGNGGRLRAFEQEDFTSGDSFKTGLEVYNGEMHPVRFCEPRYAGVIRQLGHSGADFFAQGKFMDLILDPTTITPGAEEGFWSVVVGAAAEASVERGAPVDIGRFLAEHDLAS